MKNFTKKTKTNKSKELRPSWNVRRESPRQQRKGQPSKSNWRRKPLPKLKKSRRRTPKLRLKQEHYKKKGIASFLDASSHSDVFVPDTYRLLYISLCSLVAEKELFEARSDADTVEKKMEEEREKKRQEKEREEEEEKKKKEEEKKEKKKREEEEEKKAKKEREEKAKKEKKEKERLEKETLEKERETAEKKKDENDRRRREEMAKKGLTPPPKTR